MKAKQISEEIKEKVKEIIEKFNAEHLKNSNSFYSARFRGKNLYLDRNDEGKLGPICRLTYTGKMDKWEFAIFRWSREKYDPNEWFFPGAGHVDGTVEGAMKAGIEAYPINEEDEFRNVLDVMAKLLGGNPNIPK